MSKSEKSAEELIQEFEQLEEQAEDSPETIVSELSKIVSVLQRGRISEQEALLRIHALDSIINLVKHGSDLIEEKYPEIIEATLDTPESRTIAKSVLHKSAGLVEQQIPPKKVSEGIDTAATEAVDEILEVAKSIDNDDQVPAGGAMAVHLHNHLDQFEDTVAGTEQLAVQAVTTAFEKLIEYRARLRGIDPIDATVDMKTEYEQASKPFKQGLNSDGRLVDATEQGDTESRIYMQRYILDGLIAACIIVVFEQTEPRILRTEAVLSERIH